MPHVTPNTLAHAADAVDHEARFAAAFDAARIDNALRRLAAESPRSDGELVAMATSHRSADVQDLACAVFQVRTGQPVAALERAEALAAKALARRATLAA